jgi:hypothetical protein
MLGLEREIDMRRRFRVGGVIWIAGVWALSACSSESTSRLACTEGDSRACVGAGQCSGTQVCSASGVWAACDCQIVSGGTGGAGACPTDGWCDPGCASDPDCVTSTGGTGGSGTGGSGTGGAPSCSLAAIPQPDACEQCLTEGCCSEYDACQGIAACVAEWNCMRLCCSNTLMDVGTVTQAASEACLSGCAADGAFVTIALGTLMSCVSASPTCSVACTGYDPSVLAGTCWTFDADTGGWSVQFASPSTLTASEVSFDGFVGNPTLGSLRLAIPFDAPDQKVEVQTTLGSPVDLTGGRVTARVRIDSGLITSPENPVGAKVFVKSQPDWTFEDGGWFNLDTAGGWTTVSLDVSSPAYVDPPPAVFDPMQAGIIGVEIATGSLGSYQAGVVQIDSVCYEPAATP